MSPVSGRGGEKEYWRTLEELAKSPEYEELLRREFPEGADLPPQHFSRRRFLQLMGASVALAGFSGCRWPKEEIVPYAHRPEGAVPGASRRFATTFEMGHRSTGLLVTSYDGRPIKAEGNPAHPVSAGTTDLYAQASVLGLYDPDRSRAPYRREGNGGAIVTWERFEEEARHIVTESAANGGAGLALLTGRSSSPSLGAMKARLLRAFPQARWYEYEPISWDSRREGTRIAFGAPYEVYADYGDARVILSLDNDLFGDDPAALRNAREIMARRDPDSREMNRLYVVESVFTTTGTVADHRLALKGSDIALFAGALMARLVAHHGVRPPDGFRSPEEGVVPERFVAAVASDLAQNRGRSVITAGANQGAAVHALVCDLNEALGNVGQTVRYIADDDPDRPSHAEAIGKLAVDMRAGKVDTLVLLGTNPVYDAPARIDFVSAMKKVRRAIHLGVYRDETAHRSNWHLPCAHYLESWGDARAADGTYCTVQPLIEPLYGGRTPAELIALLLGDETRTGYEIARRTMRESLDTGIDFEKFWRRALHEGIVPGTARPFAEPAVKRSAVAEAFGRLPKASAPFEVILHADQTVYDGRFANNSWLQEIPSHMTKLTWDNAANIGVATAKKLGVATGDLVRVTHGGGEITLPVFVTPGQAAGTAAIPLGYGRTAAGHVGSGVGVNAAAIRPADLSLILAGAKMEKVRGRKKLATTQAQYLIDNIGMQGRARRTAALVREGEFEAYRRDPAGALHGSHHPPLVNLWKELSTSGHAWGMATDLGKCTGCNACLAACQAENNIPVVGPDEVARGRGMHWIRIDRYFSGDVEDPDVTNQPLTCQQCENAPCEGVCPVGATQHSEEGLNDMVYNRCIGTRYCSNNCPYKVRRFNFFNNQKDLKEIEKMVYNPEVSPRPRGVMEKCSYCVQRIQNGKIAARNEGRPLADGEITPACAQVCPTGAITFGDLTDKASRVSKKHALHRAYYLLEELNIRPRNAFLARIRNTNPALTKEKESHGDTHG